MRMTPISGNLPRKIHCAGVCVAVALATAVPSAVLSQTRAYISEEKSDVYDRTYRGFDVVGELSYREEVEVLQQHKNWARIRFGGGRDGWVRQTALSLERPPIIADIHEQAFDPVTIWFDAPYDVISWHRAEAYRGWHLTVQGTIHRVIVGPHYYYLHFNPAGNSFRAVISMLDAEDFPYPLDTFYLHHEVRVSGLIKTGPAGAEMVLLDPSQIDRAYVPRLQAGETKLHTYPPQPSRLIR